MIWPFGASQALRPVPKSKTTISPYTKSKLKISRRILKIQESSYVYKKDTKRKETTSRALGHPSLMVPGYHLVLPDPLLPHIYIHIYIYILYIYMYMYTYNIYRYACTYIYTCICVYVHICCMCTYIYIYVYKYIYIYIC